MRVPIERQDWRGLSAGEQEQRLSSYLATTRQQGFELARAPLMRLALFDISDVACRFVWTQHHILMDGWCLPVIVTEFVALYRAYCTGTQPVLAEVRPYADMCAGFANKTSPRPHAIGKTPSQA